MQGRARPLIVAIHQPHFLPWLGYLHRMAQVDLFVLLDHVQYERGNYQNRTRIRMDNGTGDGAARWLTVPVMQRSQKERIVDKQVDNRLEGERRWGRVHFDTLRHAYREAPHFAAWAPELKQLLERRWERLVDLNDALLGWLRDAFGIRTPLARSSELGVGGARAELVLDICRAVGADTLLAGFGGSRTYLDPAQFARGGVRVAYHEFEHPVYRQCGAAPFVAGLSAVDLLFNCGAHGRAQLLGKAEPHESRAAA